MAANAENKVTTKGASIGINYYPNSDISLSGNYSWNSLNEKGMEIAENLASKSPLTLQVAKRAVRAALDHPISDGVLLEHNMFVDLFDTKDKDIGVNAFLERGTPEWTGE